MSTKLGKADKGSKQRYFEKKMKLPEDSTSSFLAQKPRGTIYSTDWHFPYLLQDCYDITKYALHIIRILAELGINESHLPG